MRCGPPSSAGASGCACTISGDRNLPDEADNHVVELAVAGNTEAIVTHNTRDFRQNELRFPGLTVVTPGALIAES